MLGIQASNLLLLDEPTNHLDIAAREAIEGFLVESSATLLIVSHDRRLLETVCDRLWVVGDGLAVPFDGGDRAWRAALGEAGRPRPRPKRRPVVSGSVPAPRSEVARPWPFPWRLPWRLRPDRRTLLTKPAGRSVLARRDKLSRMPTPPEGHGRRRSDAIGLRKNHPELLWATPLSPRTS